MRFIDGVVAGIVIVAFGLHVANRMTMRDPCERAGGEYVSGFLKGYCVRKDAMIKLEEGAE